MSSLSPSLPFWVNDVNINTLPGVSVRAIFPHVLPELLIRQSQKTLADGAVVTSSNLGPRIITIKGDIIASSRAVLDTNYQTLVRYLRVVEKTLYFKYGTGDKNFTGTLKSPLTTSDPQGGYMTFVALFTCGDPFAYARVISTKTSSAKTTPTFVTTLVNNGTETVSPKIVVTITSGTFHGSDTMTIQGYNTTMTITRLFATGEVITIDPATLSVKVGSTEINASGQFPVIPSGSYDITYTDTFTARNVNLTASWTERSL